MSKIFQPIVCYPNKTYFDIIKADLLQVGLSLAGGRSYLRLSRLIFFLVLGVAATPFCLALNLLGVYFINIDIRQVGSVSYLDLILREKMLKINKNKKNIFFLARCREVEGNSAAIDLYSDHVIFVENAFLKILLIPFFMNPWFQTNSHRFDTAATFNLNGSVSPLIAHEVYQLFKVKFGKPLACFKAPIREKLLSDFRQLVPEGHKFVSVHVRDSGYYNDPERTARNGNIFDYEKAFEFLISQGYYVIRMGDSNMVSINEMTDRLGPCLIDYAHSDLRSEELDCLLVHDCDFYVGLSSGIWSLSIIFEKPTVLVNAYNAATALGYGADDLTTFKPIYTRSTGTIVPLKKLFEHPLNETLSTSALYDHGFEVHFNSSDEILHTIEEFLFRKKGFVSKRQLVAKQMIGANCASRGAAGNFSDACLDRYT